MMDTYKCNTGETHYKCREVVQDRDRWKARAGRYRELLIEWLIDYEAAAEYSRSGTTTMYIARDGSFIKAVRAALGEGE